VARLERTSNEDLADREGSVFNPATTRRARANAPLDELAPLDSGRIKATFFVVGNFKMKEHPTSIQEDDRRRDGSRNHTENAACPRQSPHRESPSKSKTAGKIFAAITGRRMGLFRPPHMRKTRDFERSRKIWAYQTVDGPPPHQDFMPSRKDPGVRRTQSNLLKPPRTNRRRVRPLKNGQSFFFTINRYGRRAAEDHQKPLKEMGLLVS